MLTVDDILSKVTHSFEGINLKPSWGETSLFYNPDQSRVNGTYFLTIKENDGENDKSSKLCRDGVFRLSFGISETSFIARFGAKPVRPNKGGIIDGNYDFSALNYLTPHPIYGWMKWVAVLNPKDKILKEIWPLVNESYAIAVNKFK